jgi:acetyl-CoA C-acetyltransferase
MARVTTYLAGAWQRSDHAGDPANHPAKAMATAAAEALADAGVESRDDVDLLACVEPLSWSYADLGTTVAAELNLPDAVEHLWVPAGGTSPQDLLHKIGERMAAGEINCAVICGAESMRTRRRAMKSDADLNWPERPQDANPMRGQRPFTSELERAHGLTAPIQLFPLFENALRSFHCRTADEQRQEAAGILAANASVAADNPHAWFRDAPGVEQIGSVTADNRMIVYPYTKRMNAIMDVDQSAAIVVVSGTYLRQHGLTDHAAAVLGGAGAEEIWYPLERNTFAACPAMDFAIATALERAGVAARELDAMDLYSCFPSAIELALDALQLPADRPLSLTGGLAFAGGPGNAYVLHSLATALARVRADGAAKLLVTGIGMANAKHTATVLTGADHIPPAATGVTSYRDEREETPKTVEPQPAGAARVCTWTIQYGRDGIPVNVILILDLADGARTIANMRDAVSGADVLLAADPIGRSGRVEHDAGSGRNFFNFD